MCHIWHPCSKQKLSSHLFFFDEGGDPPLNVDLKLEGHPFIIILHLRM